MPEDKNSIIEKVTSALATFRGEDHNDRHNPLGINEKSVMHFPASAGGYGGPSAFNGGFTSYPNLTNYDNDGYSRFVGTNINYDREVGDLTRSTLVMSLVNWLGNVLIEAPLTVVQPDKDGHDVIQQGHPLVELWNQPNDFYSNSTLLDMLAMSWFIAGNAYFIKVRNDLSSKVKQLWWAPWWGMFPRWPSNPSNQVFIDHYEYRVNGIVDNYSPADVLHFRNKLDGTQRRGLSPVESAYREIYGDEQWANFSALMARNFGVPPVLINPKEGTVKPTPKELEAIKQDYMRRTTGDQRGQPIVNSAAVEVIKLGFDPKQLDFKGNRRIFEERIIAVSGIPGQVIGFGAYNDKSSYSNMETAEEAAYRRYLLPFLVRLQQTLNMQLLPDFDKNPKSRCKFDTSQISALADDEDKKWERLGKALIQGGITVFQYQQSLGLEPDENAKYYIFSRGSTPMTGQTALAQAQIAVSPDTPDDLGDDPETVEPPLEPEKQLTNGKAHS